MAEVKNEDFVKPFFMWGETKLLPLQDSQAELSICGFTYKHLFTLFFYYEIWEVHQHIKHLDS